MCPYSELFWSTFSRIRTEYGEIWSISPYSVRMRDNADQNNSEYGHFSRSVYQTSVNRVNKVLFLLTPSKYPYTDTFWDLVVSKSLLDEIFLLI